MPRQSFVHSALASAPIDRVWRALQRPETWARVGGVSNVNSASFDDNGDLTGYRFSTSVGGISYTGTAKRAMLIPGRHIVMSVDSEQLTGSIDVNIAPLVDQTAVTVELTMGSKGFAAALLFPVISGAVASGFNETVERFVTSLEE
jgi:carbon monoxide dehydrogenase subunit G